MYRNRSALRPAAGNCESSVCHGRRVPCSQFVGSVVQDRAPLPAGTIRIEVLIGRGSPSMRRKDLPRYSSCCWLRHRICRSTARDKPVLKPTTAAEAPTRDTSYIDEKGTAHVTRVVPVPEDLSPQADCRWAVPSRTRARRNRSKSGARRPTNTRRAPARWRGPGFVPINSSRTRLPVFRCALLLPMGCPRPIATRCF